MTRILFTTATLLVASFGVLAATAVDSLQRFYDTTRELQARFEQKQSDEQGVTLQVSSGTFSLARPSKFRWEYEKPYRQTMVTDGKTFWFYDRDLAQVTRRPAADALQGTPALLLSGGPALRQQFDIQDEGRREGLDWIRLTPKRSDGDFSSIRMGLAGGQPRVMELQDNLGQITRISFSGLRLNPNLSVSLFEFRIPPGVEVVDGDPVAGTAQ
jgi:outer membrane lipoprotein carrier protein